MFQEQYLTGNFSLRLNWHMHDSEISLGQTCCSYNLKIKQFLLVQMSALVFVSKKTYVCDILSDTPWEYGHFAGMSPWC